VVAADQITKAVAVSRLARGEQVNVFFGIDLTSTRNTGVAFGAFAGSQAATLIAVGVALTLLVAWFVRTAARPWLWLPVGLIGGGALGNLADRARSGAVIDFIDPSFWPAFNVADIAVVAGVLGVLYVVEGPRSSIGASARSA